MFKNSSGQFSQKRDNSAQECNLLDSSESIWAMGITRCFTVREQLGHIMPATYSELEPQQTEYCIHQNINSVRAAAILSFIEQHYPENITLSNIAEIVNISERETLRCFKKITGESPIQYLLKCRLIRSASVLTEYPDKSISIVAEECGFDSPAYYTKKFKEFYLCSPREYRQVHQAVF